MNVLSLFTGAGGGELAFQHLLTGFRTIAYVEIEDYCQRVIAQRIKDGLLDNAPIFTDIRAFINSGYCELYRGITDVITAGFPCQPFSVAGKRKGKDDSRNLWPETKSVIRLVRPRYAFLENVPGLLASGYMPQIFSDLAEVGYDARWFVLGADDIGANHRRKRLWIVADSERSLCNGRPNVQGRQTEKRVAFDGRGENDAYPNKRRPQPGNDIAGRKAGSISGGRCEGAEVADSEGQSIGAGLCSIEQGKIGGRRSGDEGGEVPNSPGERNRPGKHEDEKIFLEGSAERESRCAVSGRSGGAVWTTEPAVGRVAHGVAHRVDRLKAIGNGQVSEVARTAWEILKP